MDSPPGIGLKTAAKMLAKTDALTVATINQLIKSWKNWGSAIKAPKLPPGYYESFLLADQTFCHQRVYDPQQKKLVPLTPFPDGFELTETISASIGPYLYLTRDLDALVARGIAEGELNPITKLPFYQPVNRIHDKHSDCSNILTPPMTQDIPKKPSKVLVVKTNSIIAYSNHKPKDSKSQVKEISSANLKSIRKAPFNESISSSNVDSVTPFDSLSCITQNVPITIPAKNTTDPMRSLKSSKPSRLSMFRDSRLSTFRKKLKTGETTSSFFKNQNPEKENSKKQKTLHNLIFFTK